MISQLLFLLLFLLPICWAIDCNTAPTAAMKTLCLQITRWDEGARKTPAATGAVKPPAIPGKASMAAEFNPIASNMYQCMDIACLCVFFRGSGGANCVVQGQSFQKALRKEYRMLTTDERNRFHTAMRSIKQSGEFDRIARVHSQFASSGAAHSGPAFLPWHREFMKRVEIALRQVDPSVSLPYWDSTLDQNLPDSRDSLLWTNEFMGETDSSGQVTGGPFRQWPTIEGRPNVRRAVGAQAKLFSEDEIKFTVTSNSIVNVMGYSAPRPSNRISIYWNTPMERNVHLYVGGEMVDTPTSANDPVFYIHHSFVDYIWEIYRSNMQSRFQRETEYPPNNNLCSSEHHFSQSYMRPFSPLRNADGLSNMYTDNLYNYAPRPSCSMGNNCGSPENLLFCDRSHGQPRCAAKIKKGGKCTGFSNGEDVCYKGSCKNDVCVGGTSVQPPIATKPPVVQPNQACFNEHECCAYWARGGECNKNFVYMSEWCKASCQQCTPNYDLNNECLDRHPNCNMWSRSGECPKNPLWMSENCRSTCGKCSIPRSSSCGGGKQPETTTTPSTISNNNQQCASPGCFNEDICCSTWAEEGSCRSNPIYMLCNCKVACNMCRPSFQPGSCSDYHSDCSRWAGSGECQKNKWMLENCRRSCNSCATRWDLQSRCSHRVSRSAFVEYIRMK